MSGGDSADFPSPSTVCFFSHFGYTPPFLKANVFVLRRDVQWLAHGDLAQPSLLRFLMNPDVVWTGSILSAEDCYLPKMWKASLQ